MTLEEHLACGIGTGALDKDGMNLRQHPKTNGGWARSAGHAGFAIRLAPGASNYRLESNHGYASVQYVVDMGEHGITYESFVASGYMIDHVNWDLRNDLNDHRKRPLELIMPTPQTYDERVRVVDLAGRRVPCPPRSQWPPHHHVYHHYNEHGVLIYIGKAKGGTNRAWVGERTHASHWSGLLDGMVTVTIDREFDTQAECDQYEIDSIRLHRPCCNKDFNEGHYDEAVAARCLSLSPRNPLESQP